MYACILNWTTKHVCMHDVTSLMAAHHNEAVRLRSADEAIPHGRLVWLGRS